MPTVEERKWRAKIQENMALIRDMASSFGEPKNMSDEDALRSLNVMVGVVRDHSEFAQLVDLRKCEVVWRLGVFEALGRNLNFEEWVMSIHPKYRLMYLRWGRAAYSVAYQKRDFVLQSLSNPETALKYAYQIRLPIRNAAGDYVEVLQKSTAFQVDNEGRLLSHLNRYQVLGSYNPMHAIPEATILDRGAPKQEWVNDLTVALAMCIWEDDKLPGPGRLDLDEEEKLVLWAAHEVVARGLSFSVKEVAKAYNALRPHHTISEDYVRKIQGRTLKKLRVYWGWDHCRDMEEMVGELNRLSFFSYDPRSQAA